MPIQLGVLFSVCLLTACLATNIMLYPEVREMLTVNLISIDPKESEPADELIIKDKIQSSDSYQTDQTKKQEKVSKNPEKTVLRQSSENSDISRATETPKAEPQQTKVSTISNPPRQDTPNTKPVPVCQKPMEEILPTSDKPVSIEQMKKNPVSKNMPTAQDPFTVINPVPLVPRKEEKREAAFTPPESTPTITLPSEKSASIPNQPEKLPLPVAPEPAYASSFQPTSQDTEKKTASSSWESIDSILQRPIVYETPKVVAPLPPVSPDETLPNLSPLQPNENVKRLPAE